MMIVALATVMEFVTTILQNPLQFSEFGRGWEESSRREELECVLLTQHSGVELLIYDCGIGRCNGICSIHTVYLHSYTQSIAVILYYRIPCSSWLLGVAGKNQADENSRN